MRCPNGYKQTPPKSGNCVKKSDTKGKKKRCPNGTRKNKSGVCVTPVKKSRSNTSLKKNKSLNVNNAIQKWINDSKVDKDFFSDEEIAEIKNAAKKQQLSGKEVYDNLSDYAKGTGILVDF